MLPRLVTGVAHQLSRPDAATRKENGSRSLQAEKGTTRHQTTNLAPQLPGCWEKWHPEENGKTKKTWPVPDHLYKNYRERTKILNCLRLSAYCWLCGALYFTFHPSRRLRALYSMRRSARLMMSPCATCIRLTFRNFNAKRFVFRRNQLWDSRWVDPPIGGLSGI